LAAVSAVTVRDATPEDGRAIAAVRVETWRVAYAHIFPAEHLNAMSADEDAKWWRTLIADRPPRSRTVVAVAAGEVVGFASLGRARESQASDSLGELYAIYVLPRMWGAGVGQALMAATLDRLRQERFVEAVLWVLEDNPRTRRFYERAGWRDDGEAKDEEFLGTFIREVRYRISLAPPR
jgi:RimJ/RimL family protein N-acetyltransferase